MKEPLSTYSNAAYAIVGIIVALADPANTILAASLLFLGVGSFAFHLRGSEINTPAHRADEGAIYVVLSVLLYQTFGFESFWWFASVFGGLSYLLMNLKRVDLFVIAPALSVAIVVGLFVKSGYESAGAVLLLSLAAGFVRFRLPDTDKSHALWHVLSAAAIYFAWV